MFGISFEAVVFITVLSFPLYILFKFSLMIDELQDKMKNLEMELLIKEEKEKMENAGKETAEKILDLIEEDMWEEWEKTLFKMKNEIENKIEKRCEQLKQDCVHVRCEESRKRLIECYEQNKQKHQTKNRIIIREIEDEPAILYRIHPFYDIYRFLLNSTRKTRLEAIELFQKKYWGNIYVKRGYSTRENYYEKPEDWYCSGDWEADKDYSPKGLYSKLFPLFVQLEKELSE